MKKISLVSLVPLLVVLLTVAACSSPAATTPAPTTPAPTTPKATTPAPATTSPTPTTASIDAAPIYSANCAGCHGANREGNTGIKAPALNATTLAGKADSVLSDTITNGRTGTIMPPFTGKLTAAQINALVTFIKKP